MKIVAGITTNWGNGRYTPVSVDRSLSYSVDSAMDTDTDSWTIEIGDPHHELTAVLKRNNEVRMSLMGFGDGKIETLHQGFVDEIILTERGILTFNGRDITAVAADSQHPPQLWRQIRPQSLVAKEARLLKIGDRLKLSPAAPFKKYVTDGSETYWEVWYRFYRKRRMWMWAEPDGGLNAMSLDYNQPPSYFFGSPAGLKNTNNADPSQWIPVETMEWRANKNQRVGEIYYFGHRGDIGFVAHAVDPTTASWIKRPTKIVTSADVHNQAEARVEAWEEIFESKVGANEIKLLIKNPGFLIRQNRMALVNLPSVGLRGQFYVVGCQSLGSTAEGLYQYVRLREKNYAISRRIPSDPELKGSDIADTTLFSKSGVAADLGVRWKWYFVAAANKYRGPWAFDLFLGVLLSICQQESGFRNVRQGGSIEWPGNPGKETDFQTAHNRGEVALPSGSELTRMISAFANEPSFGRVKSNFGVGPMQLTDAAYKHAADKLANGPVDELRGARWNPQWNIMVGAAVLASKLGAGVRISPDGSITKAPISGLSVSPTEANMWAGVAAYNGKGADARKYMISVKGIYKDQFSATVDQAIASARQDIKNPEVPGGSSAELRRQVLNNSQISFTRAVQRDDIRLGMIHDDVLKCALWIVNQGYPIVITALKSDHTHLGKGSAHAWGAAIDLGNYGIKDSGTRELMTRLRAMAVSPTNAFELKIRQIIGPFPELVFPLGIYDSDTLTDHLSHIHVGFAYQGHPLYKKGTS